LQHFLVLTIQNCIIYKHTALFVLLACAAVIWEISNI